MKMTNGKIIDLYTGLKSVGELSGVKFAYAVARNIGKLQKLVEPLMAASRPTPEFSKFQVKRTAIAKDYAIKDEKGAAMKEVVNGVETYIIGDEKKFQIEFDALKVDNKELIKVRDAQIKEFEKLLDKEVEIELHMIKFSSVPKNITSQQMANIIPMIEE